MTFAEWLEKEGRGSLTRVHHASRVSYPTLAKAKRGGPMIPSIATAISAATGGEVTVEDLERGTPDAVDDEAPALATGT